MFWGPVCSILPYLTTPQVRRKEAIYRQMLEYRRSYEREAQKVAELETQRRVLEASVHAVEVCWTQVSQS